MQLGGCERMVIRRQIKALYPRSVAVEETGKQFTVPHGGAHELAGKEIAASSSDIIELRNWFVASDMAATISKQPQDMRSVLGEARMDSRKR
jgi:hypothetical protein